MSHFVGCFLSSFPCAVSLSRSSLAAGIGNRTPVISFYSVLVCLLSVYFLLDILKYIANAVLTTVIIVNLMGVIRKFKEIPKLKKSSPIDYWGSIITVIALLVFGAEAGLFIGIFVSLVFLWVKLKKTKNIVVESKLEGDHVIVWKKSLHFVNRDSLVHQVEEYIHSVLCCSVWI